jgi:hypothetical protein
MKISGVVVFEDLTEDGVEMAHEFQYAHSELQFEFAAATATIRWESFNNFAALIRLAASLEALKTS